MSDNTNTDDERENYCELHDLNIDALPDDYDFCPYCREEARQSAEMMHRATRDRRVEPW